MIVKAGDFQVEIPTFSRPDTTFTCLCLPGSKASSLTGFFSGFWLSGEGA